MQNAKARQSASLPQAPIQRWIIPVKSFLQIEAASGAFLLACAIVAILLANSPWSVEVAHFWETKVSFVIGTWTLKGDLGHLIINDALMTVFFFVVGLEIKREVVSGELKDPRKALLPIIGALGGVLAPALIYSLLQWNREGSRGWAIPMATDIAFVIGILAMFGKQIPFSLKVFLLTLAIVDDLIAVILIAVLFTETISTNYLAWAGVGCLLTYFLNKIGVRSVMVYLIVGTIIWLSFHHAGVHSTIAGVILGLMTPSKAWISKQTFLEIMTDYWVRLTEQDSDSDELPIDVEQMEFVARESMSPLHRLEMHLHPWVAFFIMPIFALANAGVPLEHSSLGDSVTVSVALALAIGKPAGILAACYLAIRFGLTSLPAGVSWITFGAGAFLGGIGFTMSLFLNSLSFPGPEDTHLAAAGKAGTLIGSLLSAGIGCSILLMGQRTRRANSK